jgi:hypothetical protein
MYSFSSRTELNPGLGCGSGAFGGGAREVDRERECLLDLGGGERLWEEGVGDGECSRKERRILLGLARPLTSIETEGL